MSVVVSTLRFIGQSTVVSTSPRLIKEAPFKVQRYVVIGNEPNGKNQITFDELKRLLSRFDAFTNVVFTDKNGIKEACDAIVEIKPAVVVVFGTDHDSLLEMLFGRKLLAVRNYTIYSRLNEPGFPLSEAETFEALLALHFQRRSLPDLSIEGESLKFARDNARKWLYRALGIEEFVYRFDGQNYKLLRNNVADRNKLVALVNDGYLVCDERTFELLNRLSLEPNVTIANAPFNEPSLLARFAALADSGAVIDRSTGRQIPVTVWERQRHEIAEVLTVLEDGSVEYAQVQRTHRKLAASLPVNRSKHTYFEDEADLMAREFELPMIPTIAEIAPNRLKQAHEVIDSIESIMRERTGHSLMAFQREDLARLLAKGFGILAWDPGCGKTIAGLLFAIGAIMMGAKPRVLVVAPQDLIPQWFREMRKFFGNEFADEWVVVDSIEQAIMLRNVANCLPRSVPLYAITWYEVLRSKIGEDRLIERDKSKLCPACKAQVKFDNSCSPGCPFNRSEYLLRARDAAYFLKDYIKGGVLIVDEATHIKSVDSQRGIAARRLITASYRLLLTGTPIKNLLGDLPMLLQLAAKPMSDAYPFPAEDTAKFARQFMVLERNLLTGRKRLAPEPTNIAVAQKLLSGIILRRTKEQTGETIVPLTIRVHKVPLTVEQYEWYKAWCSDEVFERWFYESHNKPLNGLVKLLSRMTHLLFVTSHPTSTTATGGLIPLSRYTPLPTPTEETYKNNLVIELAAQTCRDTGYCVLFAQTVSVIPHLARKLRERGIKVHLAVEERGGKVQSMPPARRSAVIRKFEEEGGILLASMSAMSHGHDLAFVSRAVIHSLCFAYDNYAQAIMRIHRIISEKEVEVHVVCAAKTIDEYLLDLLRRKDEAAKVILNGSVLENAISITPEEWRKLWEHVRASIDEIEVQ